MQKTKEERKAICKLCEICPDIEIVDDLIFGDSTGKEYIEGEIWIEDVLKGIKKEWTDLQKIAYIDNAIGKKICYAPDFGTEVFNHRDARALWKIISSGYGVCNGIAQIASYMLSQIGIKAIEVGSRTHGFLILKDIDMPTDRGIIRGDTILDPTWDLMAQRYGAYPNYFCKSYEEIRKKDILPSGEDTEAHKNDEELKDVKLNLDEKYVRQVYTSLGLAREDGQFPIKSLKEASEKIYDLELTESETIKRQFMLFAKIYPDFAVSINESPSIIQYILLNNDKLNFNRCVIKRVYQKDDKEKRPVLYVYMDLPRDGRKFYYADKTKREMVNLTEKEFEERFACYEMDLENDKGIEPWKEGSEVENGVNR